MMFNDVKRVIVGLGNPGKQYSWTRHNIGSHVVEEICSMLGGSFQAVASLKARVAEVSIEGINILLVIPTTYMNLSGETVSLVLSKAKVSTNSLLVAFDDLETQFGAAKICFNGGTRGHNGIRSIHDKLQTKEFYQFRIGIGRPLHSDIADYVLSRFTDEERAQLGLKIPTYIDTLNVWASQLNT